jgi:hypothetical protein
MHGNMVLPPIGPLFASNPHHITHHNRQLVAAVGSETLVALRTPTSTHAHAYMNGAFPSSSPVKKDLNSSSVATTKKSATGADVSGKKSMVALNLDSPKATSSSSFDLEASKDEEGSASPTCEDEKLRLSRERNRLHAQRTRIRKRELLESLKERIHALQSEHTLLKQAYEFHATAVCLLALGAGPECDHPSLKHLEDVSDAALELFDSTSTLNACLDDEDDMDDFAEQSGAMMSTHEKSCEWYNNEDDNDHHSDSGSSPSCSCTCQAAAMTPDQDTTGSQQLNSNGKRVHSSSSTLQMGGSKEEREQLRRERNRLHARRARLRKKLILERSQQAVQELRKRNEYLREHLGVLITSIYGANTNTSTRTSSSTIATKLVCSTCKHRGF